MLSTLPHVRRHWLIALLVFALGMLALGGLLWQLQQRQAETQRATLQVIAGDYAQAVQTRMQRLLSSTYLLAAMVRANPNDQSQFRSVATEVLPMYPGVTALSLSPGGVVRDIVPMKGNAALLGFDQLNDPQQGHEARLARDTGQLTLAGPMELAQGGTGVVGRLPIYLPDRVRADPLFWGFSSVSIRFPEALANTGLEGLSELGFDYELWRLHPASGQRQQIAASLAVLKGTRLQDPVSRVVPIPNGEWHLSVAPRHGPAHSLDMILYAVAGTLFSAALSLLVKLVLSQRLRGATLEHEVQMRLRDLESTRKEAETQHALAAQFFMGSNEGLLITDAQQRVMQINPAFTTITGYSEAEVLGQKPSLLSSGRHDPEFYAAMWQALDQHGHWQGEIYNRRRNGDTYAEWLSISRVKNAEGATTHYVAIFSDMTSRREQEARIRQLAYYDPLTGLANRTLLRERVLHDLSMVRRQKLPLSLLFIDLDRFKQVNDSLGHQAGDQLLTQVAQRISDLVREQDTVSRLGGDEFVVVLPETDAAGASIVADQLLQRLATPYPVDGQELTITPSIGISLFPDDGADFDALYRCADTAMYRAKQDGRNRYAFFKPEMQSISIRSLRLENSLRRAVERQELTLHYQPQVTLNEGRLVGVEALLRWKHPEWGDVSPAEFIPIAEASGLILPVGEWVLRHACEQARQWQDFDPEGLVMAVNLSAVQFRQPGLTELVADILRDTGLEPGKLELELTESTASTDPENALATMDALRALGVRLSVDDFGTGYSSLTQLKRFRVYKLKIDQSFVNGLQDSPEDARIAETIIKKAHDLGLVAIAEGVETPFQQEFLRQRGCDEIQGYLLARPLPAKDLEAWVRARRSVGGAG